MYRLTVETLLGINLEVDQLRISPCIPDHWDSYKIHYRYRETIYHISVRRAGEQSGHSICVTVDGTLLDGTGMDGNGKPQGRILLVDDRGGHNVEVELS